MIYRFIIETVVVTCASPTDLHSSKVGDAVWSPPQMYHAGSRCQTKPANVSYRKQTPDKIITANQRTKHRPSKNKKYDTANVSHRKQTPDKTEKRG